MNKNLLIKINDNDNVAVAVNEIVAGSKIADGMSANQGIPQGHKIALKDISKDGEIRRYGVVIGYALEDINQGDWINENMLRLPVAPKFEDMEFKKNIVGRLLDPAVKTFEGYKNPNGGYGGTRNILAIHTTVQCVISVLNVAVKRMKEKLLANYPNVDDIVAINHAYGCGVAIDAPEAEIPIRTLKNLVKNPNFGGEVMVVALGCEKLTLERLLDEGDNNPENIIVLQDLNGFDDMINTIMEMAKVKLERLNKRKRETLPLSELCIGMQCGGSDAFSGLTANPSAGYASDLLVSGGATVLFSEVTEVRDGVQFIAERCINDEVGKKLIEEMKWYDNYLELGGVDRSANTTPGNKKGGLSNIVEKAMGSIVKSGTSPIVEVLSPAERPSKKGLIFAATPASDFVCGTSQLASGITLQIFMTGRGTPYGLAQAPVIKVSSRNNLKENWKDLIDVSAGPIATGGATVSEVGTELFNMIIDVASGRHKTWAEVYELNNDLCLFNPAPIT